MGGAGRPDAAPVLARAVVSGRVQGVFFRATCARQAAGAGVHGWVRNLPSGEVEAVFYGPRPAVERLLAWCREGPPGASVDRVEVSWDESASDPGPFRVR